MASGGAFHRAYPRATWQAFLEGHELAFAYFSGVPGVAVRQPDECGKKVLRGFRREENRAIHCISVALEVSGRVLHARVAM
jgi:hypothetical protein